MININLMKIAIDGGAGTGKSTVAKDLAKHLSLKYINTGLMYRLIGLFAKQNNLLDNGYEIAKRIREINMRFEAEKINADWDFNYDDLFTVETSINASLVASYPTVREFAMNLQRIIGQENGIILEGRDIGTEIIPNANYKFYLTVSPLEAAKRRYNELKKTNNLGDLTMEDILEKMKKRNIQDSKRAVAPLAKANDAIEINTDNKTKEMVLQEILKYVQES